MTVSKMKRRYVRGNAVQAAWAPSFHVGLCVSTGDFTSSKAFKDWRSPILCDIASLKCEVHS